MFNGYLSYVSLLNILKSLSGNMTKVLFLLMTGKEAPEKAYLSLLTVSRQIKAKRYEARPYFESLARDRVSSGSDTGIAAITGLNISSWNNGEGSKYGIEEYVKLKNIYVEYSGKELTIPTIDDELFKYMS